MREIKFRAWDKEDEVMIDWFWLSSEGDLYETPVTVYDTPHLELERNDDLIVMQYTGLKDKNGIEIYEGDVVEITHPFRQRHHVGEVIYDGYQFNVKGFWFPHYDLPNDAFSEGTIYIEVIGNIYENPELLEREAE